MKTKNTETNVQKKIFSCKECGTMFGMNKNLSQHERNFHGREIKSYAERSIC